MDDQKFALKWDSFEGSVTTLLDSLRQHDELVDVTLCCEQVQVRAHRIMLCACSPYFRQVFKTLPEGPAVFFLKDTSPADLRAVVEFMYRGRVHVAQSQLSSFLRTAEALQIRGLSGDKTEAECGQEAPTPSSPVAKRRRLSPAPAAGGGGGGAEPVVQQQSPLRLDGLASELLVPAAHSRPPPPPAASTSVVGCPEPEVAALLTTHEVKLEAEEEEDVVEQPALTAAPLVDCRVDGGGYDESCAELDTVGVVETVLGTGAVTADDSSQKDFRCVQCGRTFGHPNSLRQHVKVHQGGTTCPSCGRVFGRVSDLRTHLVAIHGLTMSQVRRIVPTRPMAHK